MDIKLENVFYEVQNGEENFQILKNINLHIAQGEFLAILGPSGSGKTTLMNILGLLATPTQGEISFDETKSSTLTEPQKAMMRGKILGFVFQRFELLNSLSVMENVLEPLFLAQDIPLTSIPLYFKHAQKLLQKLGIEHKKNQKPDELSGGQKQRVALARSLIRHPSLILADEPTGALDSQTTEEVLNLFQELHQEGQTIILITHDPHVASFAHRVITIEDGYITSDVQQKEKEIFHKEKVPLFENSKKISWIRLFWFFIKRTLRSIFQHKLRSSLTLFGLLIGVMAIVSIIGLGNALTYFIEHEMMSATQKITLWRDWRETNKQGGNLSWEGWTLKDKKNLEEMFKNTGNIDLNISENCQISKENDFLKQDVFLEAKDPWGYPNRQKKGLEKGRFFLKQDFQEGTQVAIVSSSLISSLYPQNDVARNTPLFPLGQILKIENCHLPLTLQVIGVFKSENQEMIIPFSTYEKYTEHKIKKRNLTLYAFPGKDILHESLVAEKKLQSQYQSVFKSESRYQYAQEALKYITLIQYLILGLGFLALFTSGIGVLNMSFVSVNERVREIGVFKSLGACNRGILRSFLQESIALTFLGGLLGSALGITLNIIAIFAVIQFKVLGDLGLTDLPLSVYLDMKAVGIGLTLSILIGFLFGFIPAQKASKLDPIKCLQTIA